MLTIHKGDPHESRAAALLAQSHALMRATFPAEANHFLSLDALAAPGVAFFVAQDGDAVLGTGALAVKAGYGEVKSMFVAPAARGRGVARAMLAALEAEARRQDLPMLRLETGTGLDAAHALYESDGFVPCGPFGDYAAGPYSLFFEKPL